MTNLNGCVDRVFYSAALLPKVIPIVKSAYIAESVSERSWRLIWVGASSSKYGVMKTNKFLLALFSML